MTAPRVAVVIVNWNSGGGLAACLESIERTTREGFELSDVIVVDNASSDESAHIAGGESVRWKRNTKNVGFAAACNQGAVETSGEFLLFLNPDTRLRPDALSRAVGFLERPENGAVGIVGIALEDEEGRTARRCSRFPTPRNLTARSFGLDRLWPKRFAGLVMRDWDHAETRPVDQVMGAFFLVRRAVHDTLGGFDERFFLYFEEVDYCWRARQAGWATWYVAEARAYHEGGGSSKTIKSRRLFYSLRSRIVYAAKHFSAGRATGLLLLCLFIEPWIRVLWAVGRMAWDEVSATFGAYALLWAHLPSVKRAATRGGR